MNIRTTIILAVCIALGFTSSALAGKKAKLAKNITPREAYEMIQKNANLYVIDVRTPWEFQFVGHIRGAYNIPSNFVSSRFTAQGRKYIYSGREIVAKKGRYQWVRNPDFFYYVGQLVKKDLNAKILLYCRSAKRSPYVADKLVKAGYKNVYNMTEGFEGGFGKNPYRRMTDGWQHAGLPYQYIDKIGDLDPKYVYPGPMIIK